MKNLCCIFNIPSLYREAIYTEIDRNYNCEWYFEKEDIDVALFDTKVLKKVIMLQHGKVLGRLYRMKGLVRSIWRRKDFDAYLMVGAPMCASIWILCVLLRIFHPGKPIYFWGHCWYGKETRAERIEKKCFLKLASELFVYGEYAAGLLKQQGFRKETLHVIHNSLDYDQQLQLREQDLQRDVYQEHFGNTYPVLLFIGRQTPVKRLDMLLDAMVLLRHQGKTFNLVLVGDGSERAKLEQMVHELELKDQIWFYGPCYDQKTNAELIYNAGLCVAPGNIGLTAMHVLMYGCPALTHDSFAYQMPEFEAIKPGKTGCFFRRGDVGSLAATIDKWFTVEGTDRELVRQACYQEMDQYWNPAFQMKVIKSVIG